MHSGGLSAADSDHQRLAGACKDGRGDRDPPWWFRGENGYYSAGVFLEGRGMRKEGGGVAVLADPEENQVQPLGEEYGVLGGGTVGIGSFRLDAVNGGRHDRHLAEESIPSHVVVALIVVRWHRPLISEKDVHPIPRDGPLAGEAAVHRLWRPAAGEGHSGSLTAHQAFINEPAD